VKVLLKFRFFRIFLIVLIAGCASGPVKPHSGSPGFSYQYVPFPPDIYGPVPGGKARIFYIEDEWSSLIWNNERDMMRVFDGDVMIGDVTESSYLCWEREPGIANVTMGSRNDNSPPKSDFQKAISFTTYQVQVENGHVYYLYFGPLSEIFMGTCRKFISEGEARKFLEIYPMPMMMGTLRPGVVPPPQAVSQPSAGVAAQPSDASSENQQTRPV